MRVRSTSKIAGIFCIFTLFAVVVGNFLYSAGTGLNRVISLLNMSRSSGLASLMKDNNLRDYQLSKLSPSLGSDMNEYQVELGKMLYFDPRIGKDGILSCNSCHNISTSATSEVRKVGNPLMLNAPTLYNVVFNDNMYYDGRIKGTKSGESKLGLLTSAVLNSFTNPSEMGNSVDNILQRVVDNEGYQALFKRAYGVYVDITPELIAETISSFVATLNTVSRYDDFMDGNFKALSSDEMAGLELFISKGCVSCHGGVNLGGGMRPFEVNKPYKFKNVGNFKGDSSGMVKVPTLRNITDTGPYFHNGQYERLDEVIKEMGKMQLGISLTNKETMLIFEFFRSLSGSKPMIYVPILPPERLGNHPLYSH